LAARAQRRERKTRTAESPKHDQSSMKEKKGLHENPLKEPVWDSVYWGTKGEKKERAKIHTD